MSNQHVISDETVKRNTSSGPTASVATVREQRIESDGLVTLVPTALDQRVLNPATLPSGEPRPMPRRRARR